MAAEPPVPDPRVVSAYLDDVDVDRPPDDLVGDDRVRLKLARYGRGFGEEGLPHRIRFARVFPSSEIVSALRRQLSWIHFKQLIYYMKDELKRLLRRDVPGGRVVDARPRRAH